MFYLNLTRQLRDDAKEEYERMSEDLKNDPNVKQDRELYEKTVTKLAQYQEHWLNP